MPERRCADEPQSHAGRVLVDGQSTAPFVTHAGAGGGLSRPSDPRDHSLHRRRRRREHHAAARRQHGAAARPEARLRGQARRGRQYRHAGGRARRARRLHAAGRRDQQLRHQPVRDQDAVRSADGAGADRQGLGCAAGAVLQPGGAGPHDDGIHRLCARQSRQGELRHSQPRHRQSSDDGAAEADHRRRDHPRALSRLAGGDAGAAEERHPAFPDRPCRGRRSSSRRAG